MQCGTYPSKCNSVTAEVLARLIQGEKLTSMDAVFAASTTRLAPKIHMLKHKYGWEILSTPSIIHTIDGHVTEVSVYTLFAATITSAMAGAGAQFCESVRVARDRLRRGLQ